MKIENIIKNKHAQISGFLRIALWIILFMALMYALYRIASYIMG